MVDQVLSQVFKIFFSFDCLGNPIGIATDVKAGITNLASGNIPEMLLNFSHGLSNSTAKVGISFF